MTVFEYANQQGLSIETVRRYIRSGKLQAKREGRSYVIDDKASTAAHQDKAEIAHPNARFLPYRFCLITNDNTHHSYSQKRLHGGGVSGSTDDTHDKQTQQRLAEKDARIKQLEALLAASMQQVERLETELSESRQRSDSIIMQLSLTIEKQQSQIRDGTLLLEDRLKPKPFWQRLWKR